MNSLDRPVILSHHRGVTPDFRCHWVYSEWNGYKYPFSKNQFRNVTSQHTLLEFVLCLSGPRLHIFHGVHWPLISSRCYALLLSRLLHQPSVEMVSMPLRGTIPADPFSQRLSCQVSGTASAGPWKQSCRQCSATDSHGVIPGVCGGAQR